MRTCIAQHDACVKRQRFRARNARLPLRSLPGSQLGTKVAIVAKSGHYGG